MRPSPGTPDARRFGRRIRATRKQLGLNQIDFATFMGSKQTTISKWELGEHVPVPSMLLRFASVAPNDSDRLFYLAAAELPHSTLDSLEDLALTGTLLQQLRRFELLRPNCTAIARELGLPRKYVRLVYLGKRTDVRVLDTLQADIRRRHRQNRDQEREA